MALASKAVLIHGIDENDLIDLLHRMVNQAVSDSTLGLRELTHQLNRHRDVITTREATAYFDHKVTERTVRQWVKEGRLPGNKVGKQWFIKVDDIYRFQTGE